MQKFAKYAFLALAAVTILEYLFVFGMFTGPLVAGLICVAGLVNAALSLKEKSYNEAALYLVATVALSMGYWKVLI